MADAPVPSLTLVPGDDDAVLDEVHAAVVGHAGDRVERGRLVRELVLAHRPLLSGARVEHLVTTVLDRIEGLGPIEPLLQDRRVTDVLINGPGPVWVERDGALVCTAVTLDADEIAHLVQRVIGPQGRRADRSQPTVDAHLPGGGRLHAVLAPLAVDGPYVSIRRPAPRPVTLEDFGPASTVELLDELVTARRANVLASGATGAGKTTLIDAVAARLDPGERLVVIEESCELGLEGRHAVRLSTRRATAEGVGAIGLAGLVTESLRMRPDRLILGEVRGAEAFALVQALSTGHAGSLATIHAWDPADALRRLEALALSAPTGLPHSSLRRFVGAAIDAVVHVVRAPGGRRIESVVEVDRCGDPDAVRVLAGPEGAVASPTRSRRIS